MILQYIKRIDRLLTKMLLPDVRQQENYDCGAAAAFIVCAYFGVGPDNEEEYIQALGTNQEAGTNPYAITGYLESVGLEVEARDGMTLEDLVTATEAGKPVICAIQRHGGGHYVVISGADNDSVTFQDPSQGNVTLTATEFVDCWYDTDDASQYIQFGIIVGVA